MIRRIVKYGGYAIVVILLFVLVANVVIISSTSEHIYSVEEVPQNEVGLVLGTSSKLLSGGENPYFTNRIRTAAELLESQKVNHLILSGDNNTVYYNEPATMKDKIRQEGVPDSVLTLDYAGFRTLDSIVRCKEIFGQDHITIVTQKFHAYRALYICEYYDMNAVVASAEGATMSGSIKVQLREIFARPKALLDLYVFKKSPKFLGEKETI